MKTIPLTLWLGLALSAGTIENASAQFGATGGGDGSYGGGGYTSGGGRGSVVRLVTFPEVQQDLAFSDQQLVQVSAITRPRPGGPNSST